MANQKFVQMFKRWIYLIMDNNFQNIDFIFDNPVEIESKNDIMLAPSKSPRTPPKSAMTSLAP